MRAREETIVDRTDVVVGGAPEGVGDVVASARWAFDAAAASLARVVGDDELEYVASAGAGSQQIVGTRLPLERGVAGFVAASGQALYVKDTARDRRFARDVAESTGYVPSAVLAVPVHDGDEVLGVLSVLDPARSDGDLTSAAGRLAALAAPLLADRSATSTAVAALDGLAAEERVRVLQVLEEIVALARGGQRR